jgi:hypothetical protein
MGRCFGRWFNIRTGLHLIYKKNYIINMTLNDVKKELDELINKIENTTDSDILDELNEKKIELYNIQFMLSIGKV